MMNQAKNIFITGCSTGIGYTTAVELKKRGYIVTPDPEAPAIEAAFKDGAIKDIKLIKSSNYPALDDAAITALRLASPFQTFPKNFDLNKIDINANFEYNLIYR